MKHLSVIQHTQSEWLGHIEDHLEGRGIRFGYFRPFTAGGALPDVNVLGDGLVLVGGGPWGAATPERLLPTLDKEVRLVRACLMLGKPVIALGLGSQILSLAADGGVEQAPLRLTIEQARRVDETALGGFLPASFPNVVYMRDRPVPPDYAKVLAVAADRAPAVFQIGTNAIGFTGHPGVRRAMVEELIMEFDEAPEEPGAVLEQLAAAGPRIEDALVPIMTGLVQQTGLMARQGV